MTIRVVDAGGVALSVIDEGEGTPVLFLHGFPDRAEMWRHQIDAVTAAGFRAIAPDLRGFGDSDAPEGVEHYGLFTMLGDVAAVLDTCGADRAHVVGHDWGAAISWLFATFSPERTRSLTAVSVGHPTAFATAGVEQKQKSWYMLAFQHVGLAEEMVMRDDFAFFANWGTGGSEAQWAADLRRPGRMTSTLNIYRANVAPESLLSATPVALPPVTVATMGVWSDGDDALTEAQMRNSAAYVTAGFRYERIEGVSHWVPTAAPERLNALLLDFLTP